MLTFAPGDQEQLAGMLLESERAGGFFVKGHQNVAVGSEATMNCPGVKSCGRPPFENAPNGSNRWGLECMDFGDPSLCPARMERK